MNNYTFHGNPNGQFSSILGVVGLDVDTGNIFICSGGTIWVEFYSSGNPSGACGGLVSSGNTQVECGEFNPGVFGEDYPFGMYPNRSILVGCGFDPHCYISTAGLVSVPYTSQPLIQARLGGLIKLIEACDDSQPPLGQLTGDALLTYNNVISNVTSEINGYLSSVYPCPLAQTGTIAVLQVLGVNSTGAVTGIQFLTPGNYQTAPATTNNPAYLRHSDPLANECYFGQDWQCCQKGNGLQLTLAYTTVPYSDASGQTLQANVVSGVPVIANAGTGYNCGDLLVLTGGSSFVPGKIRQAALDLVCHSLYQRRLAPDEKNLFETMAKMWREKLTSIGGDGVEELDGTYKRFYSAGQSWNTRSVLFGANSL